MTDNTIDAVQKGTVGVKHIEVNAHQSSAPKPNTAGNFTRKNNNCSRCGCTLSNNVQLRRQSVSIAPRRDISNLCADPDIQLVTLTVHSEVAVINGGTKPWTTINGYATELKIHTGQMLL